MFMRVHFINKTSLVRRESEFCNNRLVFYFELWNSPT